MQWYYAEEGKSVGPMTEEQLKGLAADGTISQDTLVWRNGMAEWLPYNGVMGVEVAAPATAQGEGVCCECGVRLALSEMIEYQGSRVCAKCKPAFFQKVAEGVALAGVMDYGGFWIRFAAKFLDGIILWVINVIIGVIAGIVMVAGAAGNANPSGQIALNFILQGVGTVISVAYYVFFVGKFAATPGKMACKLKVVRADGSRVSYGRATGRCFAEALSYMILCIGYIMAAFDEEKRTLHDRICDTRVIRAS